MSKGKKICRQHATGVPVRDDPYVVDLVARAAKGDEGAWFEIVDRYAPLVFSICVRYQLSGEDTKDVFGTVWLCLVEQLGKLRQPAALPGWLVTTTRRECLRVLKVSRRSELFGGEPDDSVLASEADPEMIEEGICKAERSVLLRAAIAELPEGYRRLMGLLFIDPPLSYAEISRQLGIPQGSIGPMRARCMDRLRRSPLLAGLSDVTPSDETISTADPVPSDDPPPPRNKGPSRNKGSSRETGPSGETGQSDVPPSGGESGE
jgi:RNA polymerase sigma factor (sigma-70 family)